MLSRVNHQGSILREEPYSDQVEPPVNLAERATLEKITKTLNELTPEERSGGFDVIAKKLKSKWGLTNDDTQEGRNLSANLVKAGMELAFAKPYSGALGKLVSPEKLKEWQQSVDAEFGNNSEHEAYKDLIGCIPGVSIVKAVYESSQPALPHEKQPATNGDLSAQSNRTDSLESDVAHLKDTLGSQDPEAILEAVSRVDKTVGELRKEQLDQKEEADKLAEQAKKNARWKAAGAAASSVRSAVNGVTTFLNTTEAKKLHSKESRIEMSSLKESLETEMSRSSEEDRCFFYESTLQYFGRAMQTTDEALDQIDGLLRNVKSQIHAERGVESKLQGLANDVRFSTIDLAKTYDALEEERLKLSLSYDKINLGADLLGSAASAIPHPSSQAAAEGIGAINSLFQLIGNRKEKPLKKALASTVKQINKRQGIIAGVSVLKQNSQAKLQGYFQEEYELRAARFATLQIDPGRHQEVIGELRTGLKEKEDSLKKLEAALAKKEKELQHKDSAVAAAFKKKQDKMNLKATASSRKDKKAEKSYEEARTHHLEKEREQAQTEKERDALKAQIDLLKGTEDFKGSIEINAEDIKAAEEVLHTKAHAKHIQDQFSFLKDLLTTSKNPRIAGMMESNANLALLTRGGTELVGGFLSQTEQMLFAFDKTNLLKGTRLSGKIPSAAIMKSTELCEGMTNLTGAFLSFSASLKDEMRLEKNVDKTALDVLKSLPVSDLIKTAASFAGPLRLCVIAGCGLVSLYNSRGSAQAQEETNPMLESLERLQSHVVGGFRELHKEISDANEATLGGFDKTLEYLALMEKDLTAEIFEVRSIIVAEALKHDVSISNRMLQLSVLNHQEVDLSSYRAFLDNEEFAFAVEPREASHKITVLFASLQTISEHMHRPVKNGVWVSAVDEDPVNQLVAVSNNPEQSTGLLASHIGIGETADFYHFEQYAHIFSHLVAKLVLENNHQDFRRQITETSRQLLTQGQGLHRLFNEIAEVFTVYASSQKALMATLKAQEQGLLANTNAFLKRSHRLWLFGGENINPLFVQYKMDRKNHIEPRVLGNVRYNYLERIQHPLSIGGEERVARDKMYTAIAMRSGYGGYFEKRINHILFHERKWFLGVLTKEIEDSFKTKSFIQVYEDPQVQRITPEDRLKIQGTFFEVAYKIEESFRHTKGLNLCTYNHPKILEGEAALVHPIHKAMAFWSNFSPNTPEPEFHRHFAIGIELSQALADKTFEDLFSYSLIKAAEHQDEVASNTLSGRTFLVLSSAFNPQGFKQLQPRLEGARYVDFANKCYSIQATAPDGTCALHALLGVPTKDQFGQKAYFKAHGRVQFILALKTKDKMLLESSLRYTRLPRNHNSPEFRQAARARIDKLVTVLNKLGDFRGLLEDDTAALGVTLQRKTPFVVPGPTQPVEELKKICPPIYGPRVTRSAWKHIKDARPWIMLDVLQGPSEEFQRILASGLPSEKIQSELNEIFENSHMELYYILEKLGLKFNIPRGERDDINWGESERYTDLQVPIFFPKTFDDKFVEIISRVIARKWMENKVNALWGYLGLLHPDTQNPIPFVGEKTREIYRNVIKGHLDSALAIAKSSSELIRNATSSGLAVTSIEEIVGLDLKDFEEPEPIKEFQEVAKELITRNPSSRELFPSDNEFIARWSTLREQKTALDDQIKTLWSAAFFNEDNAGFRRHIFRLAPEAKQAHFKEKTEQGIERNMTAEEIEEAIRAKPDRILAVVNMDRLGCFRFLSQETQEAITTAERSKEENLNAQSSLVVSDAMFHHYMAKVQDEGFYLNIEEIGLAAHLFDKKAQVIQDGVPRGAGVAASEVFNPELQGDPIIIYHSGQHFERCLPLNSHKNAQALLEGLPKQEEREREKEKLKVLFGNYTNFLANKINGEPFGENNPFDPSAEESIYINPIILPSNNTSQLPLAFPEELLAKIDRNFQLRGLRTCDIGEQRFIPSYSFMLNKERQCYELAIEYRLFKDSNDQNPKEYCSFVVAQFGIETVDAFREKKPAEEDQDLFYNEFLIQVMYSQDPIRLPGSKSFKILQSSLQTVVTIENEDSFNALYPRLADKEEGRIVFNNDQAFQIEAHKLISSGQHGELINQLREQKKSFLQDPKADFFSIEKLRIQSERATIKKLKQHPGYKTAKEKLLLLQALLNLTVAKRLDNAIDTYAADRLVQDSYVIQDVENLIRKQKDPFEASRLEMLSLHQSHPTLEVRLLENHLLNLEAIQRMAVEDRERILSVLQDETPFSKYFPQDKKRREAAAQLEHEKEEKKNDGL